MLPTGSMVVLRHVLTGLGAVLTSRGYVTASDWELYSGIAIAIAPALYQVYEVRRLRRIAKLNPTPVHLDDLERAVEDLQTQLEKNANGTETTQP